jgi:hypothetical protein
VRQPTAGQHNQSAYVSPASRTGLAAAQKPIMVDHRRALDPVHRRTSVIKMPLDCPVLA